MASAGAPPWATLTPARHRLNLTIRPNCLTRRVVFDGKKAVGVEVESGGERFTVEGEQIILSSGAIGSPHILLLSGVGPSGHLNQLGIPVVHELPGVGQNLRDHPMIYTTFRTKPDYPLDGFAPRVQMTLRWTAEGSDLRNDMMIFMQSYATERVDRGGDRMDAMGIRMLSVLDLELSSGHLELTSSDPDEQPFLNYNYMEDPEDRPSPEGRSAAVCPAGSARIVQRHRPGARRALRRGTGRRRCP